MAKTNQDIMNQILDNTNNMEYKNVVPEAETRNAIEVYNVLESYPTAKNEFINTLTDKVTRSQFFSKMFNNPLKELHKGMLEYGVSLEELFVEMAESKGFLEHFTNTGSESTDEADLIRATLPKVQALYISRNFRLKYKSTISKQRLKSAFFSSNGLNELTNQIATSLSSKANLDEYQMMKMIIQSTLEGKQLEEDSSKGTLKLGTTKSSAVKQSIAVQNVGAIGSDRKAFGLGLLESIRATSGKMKFPSTTYNQAQVTNWVDGENQVLITTPEIKALLDVQTLANVFNTDMANVQYKIIEVDTLPQLKVKANGEPATSSVDTYALLIDKDYVQFYNTVEDSGSFTNPAQLITNLFMHRQGIACQCLFSNAVAFIGGEQPTS